MGIVKAFGLFSATALAEILGCYAIYAVVRLGKPAWWIGPGIAGLAIFAWLLTLHPTEGAGRVYAVYGGIYIVASLVWMAVVEGGPVTRWDVLGCLLCLGGAATLYLAAPGAR